ncbi:hypothetical protein Agabi119p4_9026 [Agaricus bisporus var. burnettii]|uniref:Ribosomal RNA-processing protein 14/surfeit locus protein 6 C-terminal domain-containing protein n=1 Tax=Agaricus bisporus var. burnettii TaxID=192524 RepID=A0A8H7C594_AGABI|nr:hypothetical protein Agabi119p4_9026 [Agaricus bisporus var. burnettii]
MPPGPKLARSSIGARCLDDANAYHSLETKSDPQQALEQLAARKVRLASMPEEKRVAIEEKEKWQKVEARLNEAKEGSETKGKGEE